MPTVAPIVIRAGDVYDCRIDYKTEAGAAINITGETVTLTISADNVADLVLTSGSGLTISPTLGQINVHLTSAQTTALDKKKNRRYELRLATSEKDICVGDIEEDPR